VEYWCIIKLFSKNLLLNELSVLLPPVLVFLEGKIFPELSQVEWDFPLDSLL